MRQNSYFLKQTTRQILASLTLTAILALPLTATAQKMIKPDSKKSSVEIKKLTEDQKILHVLNRLGYGARPGETERVKQLGLDKFIEAQLNPAQIDDSVAEAKVKNLDVLKMSNAELFAKYPNQAAVLQIVARQNDLNAKQLRGDLREARKEKKNGEMANDAMTAKKMDEKAAPPNLEGLSDAERR